MNIQPVTSSRALYPANPRALETVAAAPAGAGARGNESAYVLSSKTSSERAYATPTLPPGVAFVEEPSGIKIYVGSVQVEGR
jgi:hypothetical protein